VRSGVRSGGKSRARSRAYSRACGVTATGRVVGRVSSRVLPPVSLPVAYRAAPPLAPQPRYGRRRRATSPFIHELDTPLAMRPPAVHTAQTTMTLTATKLPMLQQLLLPTLTCWCDFPGLATRLTATEAIAEKGDRSMQSPGSVPPS